MALQKAFDDEWEEETTKTHKMRANAQYRIAGRLSPSTSKMPDNTVLGTQEP
jgi:hypothetical protein